MNDLKNALYNFLKGYERDKLISGRLGIVDPTTQTVTFDVVGKPGYVWVRPDYGGPPLAAFNDGAPLQYDLAVFVEADAADKSGQTLVIKRVNPMLAPVYGGTGSPPVSIPPHPMGPDAGMGLWSFAQNVLYDGLLIAKSGLTVTVKQFLGYYLGKEAFYADTEADLTSSVPGSGNHCYAIVGIDPTTGLSFISTTTPVSTATPLTNAMIEAVDVTGKFVSGAVALTHGETTTVFPADFVDLRNWLVQIPGSSSGFYQTVQGNGTPAAQEVILDFIDGTNTTVTVTDDPGGTRTKVRIDASFTDTGITQLTGDVTAGPGSGSQVATLATVNASPGTYTLAQLTVNAKGLVTLASSNGTVLVNQGGTGQTSLTAHDIIIGNGTSAVNFLAPGTARFVAISDGTDWTARALVAADIPTGAGSPLTTKGDLYTFSTVNVRLAIGANDTVLVADSSATTGNKWSATLAGLTLTTPTIASFTNATHNHQNAAGGGQLSLTAAVTGILPVGNGGTGVANPAAHNLLVGNGSSAINTLAPGAARNVAISDGTDWISRALVAADIPAGSGSPLTTKGDIYTFSTVNVRLAIGADNTVLVADSAQATGNKWTATLSSLTLDNSNTVTLKDTLFTLQDDGDTTKQLRFQLSSIATATIRTLTVPDISDTLVVLTATQALTNKTLTSPVLNTGVSGTAVSTDSTFASPSDTIVASQKAIKTYVDNVAAGLSPKSSVQEATTAALPSNTYVNGVLGVGATLTGVATGVLTVDGQTVALNDRVLVKDEGTQPHNGIYTCTLAGAIGVAYILTRATDSNTSADIVGAFVFVETGTTNVSSGWVNTNSGTLVIGTTAITYTQFSGAGEITAGTGLSKSGNTLSLVTPVALVNGGTGADLSATGAAHSFVKQSSSGAALTVGTIADGDLPTALAGHTISGGSINNTPIGATTANTGIFSALSLLIGGFKAIFSHANSADRTYTFPDRTDTVVLLGGAQTLTSKTLTTPTIGDFTNATHNHQNAAAGGQLSLTAAVTGILPLANGGSGADLSGTGGAHNFVKQSSSGAVFTVGTIGTADLPSGVVASPLTTKGDIWTYSTVDARLGVGANNTVLVADSTATTGNKWTTALTGLTIDNSAVGATTRSTGAFTTLAGAATTIIGTSDAIQLTVKGNGTQISDLVEFQDSSATVLFKITNAGLITAKATDAPSGGATFASTINVFMNSTPSADSPNSNAYGLIFQSTLLGSHELGGVYGLLGQAYHSGTGTADSVIGSLFKAGGVNQASNSIITTVRAGWYALDLVGTSGKTITVTDANLINTTVLSNDYYTATNVRGILIEGATPQSHATITNLYGLVINDQTGGGTLNYAVFTNKGLNRLGDQTEIRVSDTATTTIDDVLTLSHNISSGTPGSLMGEAILFQGDSTTTVNRPMGRIRAAWAVATDASRTSRMELTIYNTTTEIVGLRINSAAEVQVLRIAGGLSAAIPTGVLGTGAGTGAGTAPSFTVGSSSTDVSGTINVTTGTQVPAASAIVITVTFNTTYAVAPRVVLQAANAVTARLNSGSTQIVVTTTTTTFVLTSNTTGIAASTAYSWDYVVN